MCTPIKQEFKLRNFCLNYEHPYHFYTSSIENPKHFYLVWRIFWLLFHCGGIFAIFMYAKTPYLGRLLTFATIWGYLCLSLTTLYDLIFVVLFQYVWPTSRQEKHQHGMPWYFKASWFISIVAYNSSLLITCAYWILLFTGDELLGITIMEHAINSVYTFLNIFVTNMPVRILHFWPMIVWLVVYIAFTGIYYLAGGLSASGHRYIYAFMDFNQPKKMAIHVFALAIAGPIFQCVIFLLYRTRLCVVRKCQRHSQSVDDLTSSKRSLEIIT